MNKEILLCNFISSLSNKTDSLCDRLWQTFEACERNIEIIIVISMFHEIKFSTANHQLPNAFLANKVSVLNELVFSLVE